MLDDRVRARSLGAAGRDYWERNLTPGAVAERHLDVYDAMLAQRGGDFTGRGDALT
jgi:hypothetical protein